MAVHDTATPEEGSPETAQGVPGTAGGALPDVDSPAHRFGYRPGLDGLRAFGIVVVMLYHADVTWFPTGFFVVDMFMVLSGYLITTLLVFEWRDNGRIGIGDFYLRRAKRLLPALFVMVAFVVVYTRLFGSTFQVENIRGDALATMGYVANWWYALSGQNYFELFESQSMLGHTWSLSIEEQFYVVWPVVTAFLLVRFRTRLQPWLILMLSLAGLSALLMAVMSTDPADSQRVYYGTDTRAQAFFIGAALAFVLREVEKRKGDRSWADPVAAIGFALLVLLMVVIQEDDTWFYRGGFLVVAIVSAMAVCVAIAPRRGVMNSFLGNKPMVWLGERSYGIYLWHLPVFVILEDRLSLDLGPMVALKLTLAIALGVLSYHFIEMPIRRSKAEARTHVIGYVTAFAGIVALVLLVTVVAPPKAESINEILAQQIEDERSGLCSAITRPEPEPGRSPRVLLAGDSIAFSLGFWAKERTVAENPLDVRTCAILGCGMLQGPIAPADRTLTPTQGNCSAWEELWTDSVTAFDPEVAVLEIGTWDIFNRVLDDETLVLGTPEWREALTAQFTDAVDVLRASGAEVVLLSVPCHADHPDNGTDFVEWADDARLEAVNAVIREVAEAENATFLDINERVCPTGEYQETVDNVRLHDDGLHYNEPGALLVWDWLIPQLQAVHD